MSERGRVPALVGTAVLASLLLGVTLFATTRRGLWDPDETRCAEAAREMLLANDLPRWTIPHLDQREDTTNPPLLLWLEAASSRVTGGELTAVSARFPQVLSGLVVFLATAALGRRLLGPKGAVAAGLGLLLQGQFLWQCTVGQAGQLLAAFEVGGTACLVLALFPERGGTAASEPPKEPSRGLAALGFVLLGLGVLAMGPVSVVVPLLTLTPLFLLARPRLGKAWLGLPLGLLPAVVWSVAAARLGAHETWRFFADTSPRIPAPRLWAELLAWTLPGSLFLVPAVGEALRAEWHAWRFGASAEERLPTLLPLAWLFVTLASFSIGSGRRSVSMVPAFPAVALLLAWFALRPRGSTNRASLELEHFTGWFILAVAALAVPVVGIAQDLLPWVEWELGLIDFRIEAALAALWLLVAGGLLALDRRAWFPVLALGTLATFAVVHVRVVPWVDPAKSAERAAQRFTALMPKEAEWATIGEPEPGLVFYSRKWVKTVTHDDPGIHELHAWFQAREGKPSFVVVVERNDATVQDHFPELKELSRVRIGADVYLLKK